MNRTGTDKIQLVGLTAQASHGVYDFERTGKQTFIVDVTAFLDTRRAGLSDRLEDTLNYGQLAGETIQILTGPSVSLLETLAEMIAEQALTHEIVQSVEVTVHKPQAPIQYQFQDVSVTVYRTRQDVGQSVAEAAWSSEGVGAAAMSLQSSHSTAANLSRMPSNSKGMVPAVRTGAHPAQRVVLGLGGNLGRDQRANQRNLTDAVQKLIEIEGFEIREVSPLVQTLPVLAPEQEAQGDYYNAVIIGETTLEPEELLRRTQAVEDSFGRDRSQHWGPRPVDIDLVDVDNQECRTESLTLPHPLAYQRAFVLFPWSLIAPNDTLSGQPITEWLKIAPDRDGVVNVWDNWLIEPELFVPETGQMPEHVDGADYSEVAASATWGSSAGSTGARVASPEQFEADNPPNSVPSVSVPPNAIPRQRPRLQRDVAVRPTPAGQVSISDTGGEFFAAMDSFEDNIVSGLAGTASGANTAFGGTGGQPVGQSELSGQFSRNSGASAERKASRNAVFVSDNWPEYQANGGYETGGYSGNSAGNSPSNPRGGSARSAERRSIRQMSNSPKTETHSEGSGQWANLSASAQNTEDSQTDTSRVYKAPPFGSIFGPQVD